MKHLGKTPPFRGPDGKILPNSVAESSCFRLGRFDQWVMIRGENIANPILILLHGSYVLPERVAEVAHEIFVKAYTGFGADRFEETLHHSLATIAVRTG